MGAEIQTIIETTVKSTIEETIKNANLIAYDRLALIISIIAIVVSIIVAIWTAKRTEKSNYRNNYYQNILLEPLQKKLPLLLHKTIDNQKINKKEASKLEKYIAEFRNIILPFKYIDEKFYKKFDTKLIELDEILVVLYSKDENFNKNSKKLYDIAKKLYKLSEKYLFKIRITL